MAYGELEQKIGAGAVRRGGAGQAGFALLCADGGALDNSAARIRNCAAYAAGNLLRGDAVAWPSCNSQDKKQLPKILHSILLSGRLGCLRYALQGGQDSENKLTPVPDEVSGTISVA